MDPRNESPYQEKLPARVAQRNTTNHGELGRARKTNIVDFKDGLLRFSFNEAVQNWAHSSKIWPVLFGPDMGEREVAQLSTSELLLRLEMFFKLSPDELVREKEMTLVENPRSVALAAASNRKGDGRFYDNYREVISSPAADHILPLSNASSSMPSSPSSSSPPSSFSDSFSLPPASMVMDMHIPLPSHRRGVGNPSAPAAAATTGNAKNSVYNVLHKQQ